MNNELYEDIRDYVEYLFNEYGINNVQIIAETNINDESKYSLNIEVENRNAYIN